jgi:hypothetical protein
MFIFVCYIYIYIYIYVVPGVGELDILPVCRRASGDGVDEDAAVVWRAPRTEEMERWQKQNGNKVRTGPVRNASTVRTSSASNDSTVRKVQKEILVQLERVWNAI